jgi:type II secretory pathway pseudopilin PulG
MHSLIKKGLSSIKQKRGFLLIEILLSVSLFTLLLTAFATVFSYGVESSSLNGSRMKALLLAEEGQEAVRTIKNTNFTALTSGTYGLQYTSGAWQLIASPQTENGYTRSVTITTVSSARKDVVVTVTWQQTPSRTGSLSLRGRVTNWRTPINLGIGITVNKVLINKGLSLTASSFAPYKVGTTTVSLASSTIFGQGTYIVSEVTDSRYDQTFSGDCNASGQITVTATGTSLLCTITNTEKQAYITVNKTVINKGGTKIASDFAPYKVGSTTVVLGAITPINSGTYSITETYDPNYIINYSGDCFTNGTISILSGESKTCTITNEEIVTGSGLIIANVLLYGDGTNVPKYRSYNKETDELSAETGTFTATVGPTWIVRTAPDRHIALGGYYDSTGTLTVMCFDGTNWIQEFQAPSGGIGNRHRFDIAYEQATGDALIVYSKGPHVFSQLGYRTKPGGTACGPSSWSGETLFDPARTSNDIMYVRLSSDKRVASHLIGMTWVDTSDDISAAIWNGSSFVNEPTSVTDNNVERVSSSHDIENMDLEYESISGDLMLVWGNGNGNNGTNGVRYRVCTGGIAMCTWGAVTTPPTFIDDATNLDLSVNPLTDEMVFASIGNAGGDLQIGYWNGSAWTNTVLQHVLL